MPTLTMSMTGNNKKNHHNQYINKPFKKTIEYRKQDGGLYSIYKITGLHAT